MVADNSTAAAEAPTAEESQDTTWAPHVYPLTVPDGAHMGNNPTFTVVKRNQPVPEGYYLTPMWTVREYWEQIKGMVNQDIGDWAVVGFEGGKINGAGHAMDQGVGVGPYI